MRLNKYSMGIGDRFGKQGKAQLTALIKAEQLGVNITPVWNKSHREHLITKSSPEDVRIEANQAVHSLDWKKPYFVDADHINSSNIDLFIDSSDYFTIDIADYIGKLASDEFINQFLLKYEKIIQNASKDVLKDHNIIRKEQIIEILNNYLNAVQEAGRIYRHIKEKKNDNSFVTEISMDETETPQTPIELMVILAAIAEEKIPVQTIALKFKGRFNKGVDYVGDLEGFATDFENHLIMLQYAIQKLNLPNELKLSIHSGSDKFSIYKIISRLIKKYDMGLHLKTAGTTWLEELIGLLNSGDEGFQIVKEIYIHSLDRFDELCKPYKQVIDIKRGKLPTISELEKLSKTQLTEMLKHDPSNPKYNKSFRQLLHVSYKIAAEMGKRYTNALAKYQETISKNVTLNLFERHIKPLFL